MTAVGWLAVIGAGLAVWLWLPPPGRHRLRVASPLRLPVWAQPLPGALDSRKRWWVGGLVAGGVVVYGWDLSMVSLGLGPLVAVAVWLGLGRLEPTRVRQQRLQTLEILPQGLDLLRACLRAGQPLPLAVETVARAIGPPLEEAWAPVSDGLAVGLSQSQAWGLLADDPVLGGVARDLARSAAWGTATADVLAHHGADLRRQVRTERLASAKAVGVKAVLPLGICYLPAFVVLGVVPIIAAGIVSLF